MKAKTTSVEKISIKPLMGFVLIEPVEAEEKTSSGIILPSSAQEKPALGKVLAAADNSPVKVGDMVFYKKWGGDEIKINGKELKLVKFEDLMATFE
jgi:chaperonin GroES